MGRKRQARHPCGHSKCSCMHECSLTQRGRYFSISQLGRAPPFTALLQSKVTAPLTQPSLPCNPHFFYVLSSVGSSPSAVTCSLSPSAESPPSIDQRASPKSACENCSDQQKPSRVVHRQSSDKQCPYWGDGRRGFRSLGLGPRRTILGRLRSCCTWLTATPIGFGE